jgi:hypothetical protein
MYKKVIQTAIGIIVYRDIIKNPDQIVNTIESVASRDNVFNWLRSEVYSENQNQFSQSRTNRQIIVYRNSSEHDKLSIYKNIMSEVFNLFDKAFSTCLNDYLCRMGTSILSKSSDSYTVLKYSKDETFMPHLDDGPGTDRRVSLVGYLNDNFDGGALEFPLVGFSYQPCAGDIIAFPSGSPFNHGSIPVKSGIKYSVVSWYN